LLSLLFFILYVELLAYPESGKIGVPCLKKSNASLIIVLNVKIKSTLKCNFTRNIKRPVVGIFQRLQIFGDVR